MQGKALAVALALATGAPCAAQQQMAALDEVVVTATRFKDRFDDKPVNMTVITGEDIRRSAAKTVPDLLAEQAGIQIHDFFGNNAATTTVDLRGFGITGTQNTLILWQRLVVQRRLRNHPVIVRLTGSEVLQTVRLRSLVTGQGQCVVGGCFFKVVVSGQLVDNIAGGRTGNFCASVNREDGALRPALALSSSGIGTEPMPHHPRTGHAIAGFRLPWWEEAKALVRRAATLFSPHRTIGWDVGLTPEGPALIEGNSWWDPVNLLASSPADLGYSREMADLLARLRAEATR